MVVGNYTHPTHRAAYIKSKLEIARGVIKDYPNLCSILDNFDFLENELNVQNVFFYIASWVKAKEFLGTENLSARNRLSLIEEILKFINPESLESKRKNYFYERMRSNDVGQSSAVLSEIELIYFLKAKNFKIDISPVLHSGKNPELTLKLEDKEIFIEQTDLDISLTERKIQEIFEKAAKWVYERLKSEDIVHMTIESSKLVWDLEGHIVVDDSVKKITESIDKLNLWVFFKQNVEQHSLKHHFRLADLENLSSPDKLVIESEHILEHYGEIGRYLVENISDEQIQQFVNSIKVKDIIDSPIHSFYSTPARYKLVEITTNDFYPNDSSLAQQKAFVKRILNKIYQKIEERQRHPDKPNLLLIKAQHWTIHAYTDASDEVISNLIFEPMKNKIEVFLSDKKVSDLSAIILYESDIKNCRILLNKNAKDECKLSLGEIKNIFANSSQLESII